MVDIDLSYAETYIEEEMVDKLVETRADIVIASPYMKRRKSNSRSIPAAHYEQMGESLHEFCSTG